MDTSVFLVRGKFSYSVYDFLNLPAGERLSGPNIEFFPITFNPDILEELEKKYKTFFVQQAPKNITFHLVEELPFPSFFFDIFNQCSGHSITLCIDGLLNYMPSFPKYLDVIDLTITGCDFIIDSTPIIELLENSTGADKICFLDLRSDYDIIPTPFLREISNFFNRIGRLKITQHRSERHTLNEDEIIFFHNIISSLTMKDLELCGFPSYEFWKISNMHNIELLELNECLLTYEEIGLILDDLLNIKLGFNLACDQFRSTVNSDEQQYNLHKKALSIMDENPMITIRGYWRVNPTLEKIHRILVVRNIQISELVMLDLHERVQLGGAVGGRVYHKFNEKLTQFIA